MDALRKSIGSEGEPSTSRGAKKPPVSENEPAAKSIGLVKPAAKSAPRRKTA
jgi:hypothetical protein